MIFSVEYVRICCWFLNSCFSSPICECVWLSLGQDETPGLWNLSRISTLLTHTVADNRTEQREAQRLASFTGERMSPYLFISSAPRPKYLAKSLLQKRTSKARPSYPRLILTLLIKMRITCAKHWEGDWGKENSGLTFKEWGFLTRLRDVCSWF